MVAGVVATMLLAGCGPDVPSASGVSESVESSASDGAQTTSAGGSVQDSIELPPMRLVAGLGYPRDLLDRGRVNIRIDRADDVEIVLLDHQLVARHFTPPPPEERRTVIPPNGQVVAVQSQFGDVTDCDEASSVEAELVVSYTLGDDPVERHGSIEVDDTTTLDDIRLQICTQRRVVDRNEFELRVGEVDGETMTARLVVRRRDGDDRLAFDAITGTVLFGVAADVPADSPERVLESGEQATTIALTFDVNRCDPHAVGETTRKYGLDVHVAVDGIAAQRVPVPIEAVIPRLDEMLEHCKERTGR